MRDNERQHINVVYTQKANCQDCYRCVRFCPVKAIRIHDGQAQIVDSLCVQCGTCVRECPQNAKQIRSDLDDVKELIATGVPVAVSVAPSFAALNNASLTKRFPGMLRLLGFRYVSETAEGAEYITEKSFASEEKGCICTACPAVVKYVEKYNPKALSNLIPVVSPMIAHGRMLKEKYNNCPVVFIGPCAAKKEEAARPENMDAIDFVLTFQELAQWMEDERITLDRCSESGFDSIRIIGEARLFPLEGGMLATGGFSANTEDSEILRISGADEVISLLNDEGTINSSKLIEPLFCKGGCLGGPAFPKEKSTFERRNRIIDYWKNAGKSTDSKSLETNFRSVFAPKDEPLPKVSENEINHVLEYTGKTDPKYQLNCGACGYPTCRENAIAIVRKMAETEMCMPYMRRLAQQRTDRIMETAPTGIVLLDGELRMIKMNPAFQKMFTCNNGILGRRISYLVNADGFEQLQTKTTEKFESIQTKYGVRYHEILYSLREDNQYVGIYADISNVKLNPAQMELIKSQTLIHAKEFLEHQLKFAQEMAHYLGKSSARSEEIARRLISLYEEEAPGGKQ